MALRWQLFFCKKSKLRAGWLLTRCVVVFFVATDTCWSQILPPRIGAVAVGWRQFTDDATYFDSVGSHRTLGSKLDVDFTADQMASGKAGSDLRRLYDEVKKFDSENTGDKGLADQMNFGHLRGQVQKRADAKFLGASYGMGNGWSLFMGAPIANVTIDTQLSYEGSNNANEIKSRLGNAAFREIQDGLTEASKISAESVKDKIVSEYGYKSLDHWEYHGIGDLVLGARRMLIGSRSKGERYTLQVTSQVEVPTGHADDPDILTDASVGRGYIAPQVGAQQRFAAGVFAFGLDTSLGIGVPTQTKRRVPLGDEVLISTDRRSNVNWIPGPEVQIVGSIGSCYSLVTGAYRIGMNAHLRDRYSGSMDGNYSSLNKASEKTTSFHEAVVELSTVDKFLARKFDLPFVATLTVHDAIGGRNSIKSTYVELSVATFFRGERSSSPDSPANSVQSPVKINAAKAVSR